MVKIGGSPSHACMGCCVSLVNIHLQQIEQSVQSYTATINSAILLNVTS